MVGVCVQEKEMEKQKLLYQQARLHDRGAAEMVLQTISASKGEAPPSPGASLLAPDQLCHQLLTSSHCLQSLVSIVYIS